MQNKKIIIILKNSLIWLFIFLVLGGIGSWFLFQKVKREEITLEEVKNNYNTTLKQLEHFDSIKGDLESSKELKGKMESMIVKPDGTLELIEELEKAAQSSGVTLKTSIAEKPGLKNNLPKIGQAKMPANNASEKEMWFQLEIDGSFPNILQFIRYLENAKKLISVGSISIDQTQDVLPGNISGNKSESPGNLKAVILVSNVF